MLILDVMEVGSFRIGHFLISWRGFLGAFVELLYLGFNSMQSIIWNHKGRDELDTLVRITEQWNIIGWAWSYKFSWNNQGSHFFLKIGQWLKIWSRMNPLFFYIRVVSNEETVVEMWELRSFTHSNDATVSAAKTLGQINSFNDKNKAKPTKLLCRHESILCEHTDACSQKN